MFAEQALLRVMVLLWRGNLRMKSALGESGRGPSHRGGRVQTASF